MKFNEVVDRCPEIIHFGDDLLYDSDSELLDLINADFLTIF